MSINSLTNAATARRADFAPLNRPPNSLSEIASAAAGMPAAETSDGAAPPPNGMTAANGVNTAMQVLFGYIPTEVVTLYVAVVAAIHPNSSDASGTGAAGAKAVQSAISSAVQKSSAVTPIDWGVFWSFLVATPVVLWVVYATKLKGA